MKKKNNDLLQDEINKKALSMLQEIKPERYIVDDITLSNLFIKLYGSVCRYCREEGVWYSYNGQYWANEMRKPIIAMHYAKDFQRVLGVYALTYIKDDQKRDTFFTAISRYGNNKYLNNLLACAESCDPISSNLFNKNTDLFNCQNGTYNLRTGEWKEHDHRDYLTQISNVIYDEHANYDLWAKTVNQIMENNHELIMYLQKMFGYSITAESSLENFFICWGATTRNGKSTLLETLAEMLGDYAETLDPSSLSYENSTKRRGGAAAPDIYKLKDVRFVVVREPERKVTLASSLLKTITGRDTMSARTLYVGKEIKFSPICKVWFNTNWKFSINDITLFTSHRIRLIPFKHHFTESEQNKTLKDELAKPENLSGLFNWCLEGLKQYRSKGESEPIEITNLIKEYECEEDTITRFISTHMERREHPLTHKLIHSAPSAVYEAYEKWGNAEHISYVGKRRFYEELRSRNLLVKNAEVNGQHYKEAVYGLVLKNQY